MMRYGCKKCNQTIISRSINIIKLCRRYGGEDWGGRRDRLNWNWHFVCRCYRSFFSLYQRKTVSIRAFFLEPTKTLRWRKTKRAKLLDASPLPTIPYRHQRYPSTQLPAERERKRKRWRKRTSTKTSSQVADIRRRNETSNSSMMTTEARRPSRRKLRTSEFQSVWRGSKKQSWAAFHQPGAWERE